MLSESDIRRIAEIAKRELGNQATPEILQKIVREVVGSLYCENITETELTLNNSQICVAVIGRKMDGAKDSLATTLATSGCKVLQCNTSELGNFTTLLALVDATACSVSLPELEGQLRSFARRFGGNIMIHN